MIKKHIKGTTVISVILLFRPLKLSPSLPHLFLSLKLQHLSLHTRTFSPIPKGMAQKRETEETELKVPETITLCSPPIAAASSNMPGSDDRRSSPDRSDPKTGGASAIIVDLRPNTAASLEKTDLSKKRRSEALDKSISDRLKKRDVNRCSGCNRKVGLMGFRCRCGEMFCSEHRYSDRHDCSYDYKAAGREAIARENPVVRAAKILKV